MSQYYLMAQLPSLDGLGENSALPITEERFYELCSRFLSKKAIKALNELTLLPRPESDSAGYAIVDKWYESERALRFALAGARAEKMKKPFDGNHSLQPPELLQAVQSAVAMENPLEAEKFLNSVRMELLEALRPSDYFSDEAVFYYALKLKLISRIQLFDEVKGERAYRNIYVSIMDGDKQEAIQ